MSGRWTSLAVLRVRRGEDPKPRLVTVCPHRRLRPAIKSCVGYWSRARGLPSPPIGGSVWDWPALLASVWELCEAEMGVIQRYETAQARAEAEAEAAARRR